MIIDLKIIQLCLQFRRCSQLFDYFKSDRRILRFAEAKIHFTPIQEEIISLNKCIWIICLFSPWKRYYYVLSDTHAQRYILFGYSPRKCGLRSRIQGNHLRSLPDFRCTLIFYSSIICGDDNSEDKGSSRDIKAGSTSGDTILILSVSPFMTINLCDMFWKHLITATKISHVWAYFCKSRSNKLRGLVV